jgi:hypothetical protein
MHLSPRIKDLLGRIPGLADTYWRYVDRAGPTVNLVGHHSLERLRQLLPEWGAYAETGATRSKPGKDIMLFATFRYWIEFVSLMGLALAGLGHRINLAFLPYSTYKLASNLFDLRRQNAYIDSVLRHAAHLLRPTSLIDVRPDRQPLPQNVVRELEELSLRDTQYWIRVEEVDRESELYRIRFKRNEHAARLAMAWLQKNRPQVVIIPNGSIQEFGAVYHVARYLDLPVVTFEFDEPQNRIRLAQNAEVMREETDAFWLDRRHRRLSQEQLERVRALLTARQRGSIWENYPIQFQDAPPQGEQQVRSQLGLDHRKVVLLAPNVFGDSATLSRQIFSHSLTEWLVRTLHFFAPRDDIQLVIRIHPSETRFPEGTSMAEVVQQTLPELPEHVHMIPADASVNTYDIIEIADLGLVYTTTVGMEMAMRGVPVIVAGVTHYRGKGFTLDPDSWDSYYEAIERVLQSPSEQRLSKQQLKDVWQYAYHFFFEFTLPFPWHLLYFWDDVAEWPLDRVLSEQGQALFGDTFHYLVGEKLDWSVIG